MEDSVFIQPFKLQEKTDISIDQSLLYHDTSMLKQDGTELNMSRTGAESGAGGSRFSMSFAKDEEQKGNSSLDMNVIEV
jgi:hypothetical protein